MKSLVTATFLAIAIIVIWLLIHVGGFKSVQIETREVGPLRLISRHHLGAYHKIEPMIEEVETWARAHGEDCRESFGEYIDNPDTTDEDRLNANVGCVVEKDRSGEKLPEGMSYREIPRRLYAVATFEGAPSIVPIKVYPRVEKFIRAEGLKSDGALLETYETRSADAVETRSYFPVLRGPNSAQ